MKQGARIGWLRNHPNYQREWRKQHPGYNAEKMRLYRLDRVPQVRKGRVMILGVQCNPKMYQL